MNDAPFKKCVKCKIAYKDLLFSNCKVCGDNLIDACILDNIDCNHEVSSGIKVCPECGEFVCPICGCHDVIPISRITGYYSPVSAWGSGKVQELKDRVRYDV